ncbi:hypothetical protein Q1695_006299 [Nippostrongylus brasiliensis]|nr:hypothetical protein Q1695_006299 [Nippostrongylus brasiliensis]
MSASNSSSGSLLSFVKNITGFTYSELLAIRGAMNIFHISARVEYEMKLRNRELATKITSFSNKYETLTERGKIFLDKMFAVLQQVLAKPWMDQYALGTVKTLLIFLNKEDCNRLLAEFPQIKSLGNCPQQIPLPST